MLAAYTLAGWEIRELASLVAAVAALGCLILLVAGRRILLAPQHAAVAAEETSAADLPPKAAAAAEAWELKLEELGREQCGRIDSKLVLLQTLLRQAEETIARLNQEVNQIDHRSQRQ